jgi:hypothetical protein
VSWRIWGPIVSVRPNRSCLAERACPSASFIDATVCGKPAIARAAVVDPLVSFAAPSPSRVEVCKRLSTGSSTRSTVAQSDAGAGAGAAVSSPVSGPGIEVNVTSYFPMRHKAVRVSIDGVPLGVALSQIAGVHREKCLLLRLGEPRLGQDRSGDCVDLTARLGGLGVWTRPRGEVF